MNRRELRAAMRERRAELKREMVALRQQTRARLEQDPAIRRERQRRRVRRGLWLIVLLLLLLLSQCECERPAPTSPDAGPVPTPSAVEPVKRPEPKKPAAKPAKPKPLDGKVAVQTRGTYEGDVRPPPSWLDEFRLQVAARSPRLAACFTGTERPGALRWTTAVNPKNGAVSDHDIEPLGPATVLTADQRACVLKALSEPKYRINAEPGTLPDRVGLVIEF